MNYRNNITNRFTVSDNVGTTKRNDLPFARRGVGEERVLLLSQSCETTNKHSFALAELPLPPSEHSRYPEKNRRETFGNSRYPADNCRETFGTPATLPTTVGRLSGLPLPCRQIFLPLRNFRYHQIK